MAYHTMWRKFGGMPEFYNLAQQECMQGREGYPLRPGNQLETVYFSHSFFFSTEHIESLMYLYKATGDETLLFMAVDIFEAIESCCKTTCGYTSVCE